jgi:hypothetical protein
MRFAHMKRVFKLDRLRLRGLSGAKGEVLLTATAQNLRAPSQVPLSTAATDDSPLCGRSHLQSRCIDNPVRHSQQTTP